MASVEYNQIEPLLISCGHAGGDVNETEGSAYKPGYSRFPGNINELIFSMEAYVEVVAHCCGHHSAPSLSPSRPIALVSDS